MRDHFGRRLDASIAGALMIALAVLSIQPARAGTLADLNGRWILTPAVPGHLGFMIDVQGRDVQVVETIRVGAAQCRLTAVATQPGQAAIAKFSVFSVTCDSGRGVFHRKECSFAIDAAEANLARVTCARDPAEKTATSVFTLRRSPAPLARRSLSSTQVLAERKSL